MRHIQLYDGDTAIVLLKAEGFEFVGHTWLLDDEREVVDEYLFISEDKQYFLWLNFIDGTAYLYKLTNEKPEARLERLNPPYGHPDIFVSEPDQQFVEVHDKDNVYYYRLCYKSYDLNHTPLECEVSG